ncbi:hypothetical protein DFJ74DRAFT_708159 [Hyaloraphidium curvatum]|nr:hypothetical protein DFJ74DRAFT_708159 [Hyaloraphidium curvatum]
MWPPARALQAAQVRISAWESLPAYFKVYLVAVLEIVFIVLWHVYSGVDARREVESDYSSIDTFVERFRQREPQGSVSLLVNNAGLMDVPFSRDAQNVDMQTSVNYLYAHNPVGLGRLFAAFASTPILRLLLRLVMLDEVEGSWTVLAACLGDHPSGTYLSYGMPWKPSNLVQDVTVAETLAKWTEQRMRRR